MPNTLAHIGAQGIVTKLVWRDAEPRWILLGCIIPDTPWIIQRILTTTTDIDPMLYRPYLDYQGSLLGCVILSLAVACLADSRRRVALILTFNAVLHLVVDAIETKWGNGVHFFAPASWTQTNWGLFWPDSLAAYMITALGAAFVAATWKGNLQTRPLLFRLDVSRALACFALLTLYLAAPLLFNPGQIDDDRHFGPPHGDAAGTEYNVAFDRANLEACGDLLCLIEPTGKQLPVLGVSIEVPATVSLKGTIVSGGAISVTEHHVHQPYFRDGATYAGIVAIVIFWIGPLFWRAGQSSSVHIDPQSETNA